MKKGEVTHLRRRFRDLLKFFTGGNLSTFVASFSPKFKLELPAMQRLMNLANAIEDDIQGDQTSSRQLGHLYTNLLACVASSGNTREALSFADFQNAGWKFGRNRYGTARKRQLENAFVSTRPKKRGRQPIPEELKKRIEEFWEDYARPAANKEVTNPNKVLRSGLCFVS